jgi:hypothetical protein
MQQQHDDAAAADPAGAEAAAAAAAAAAAGMPTAYDSAGQRSGCARVRSWGHPGLVGSCGVRSAAPLMRPAFGIALRWQAECSGCYRGRPSAAAGPAQPVAPHQSIPPTPAPHSHTHAGDFAGALTLAPQHQPSLSGGHSQQVAYMGGVYNGASSSSGSKRARWTLDEITNLVQGCEKYGPGEPGWRGGLQGRGRPAPLAGGCRPADG